MTTPTGPGPTLLRMGQTVTVLTWPALGTDDTVPTFTADLYVARMSLLW